MKTLLFGSTGWIGNKMIKLLENHEIYCATSRLEDKENIIKELDTICPDRVINCAGITGKPNVDWCEDHKQETIRTNIVGVLLLTDLCQERNIHLTHFASGCIYHYDISSPLYPFSEDDPPNFDGSFYSKTKGYVDELLKNYNNTLVLRLRLPIDDTDHPRNLITKLLKYERVVNEPNSVSVLPDLLPIAVDMIEKEITGTYNFVNSGVLFHNELLYLYREYVNKNYIWKNFSLVEQNNMLKARRSNCVLSTKKLEQLYDIPEIHESLKGIFMNWHSLSND